MATSYSKMPLWKMILLYLVIGGLVYWLIYYFVFAKKGGYKYDSNNYNYTTPQEQYTTPSY